MRDFSTPSWHDLNLNSLKLIGSEYHGPCPVTHEGKDRFHINPDRETLVCRGCSTDGGKLVGAPFREHLEALGMVYGSRDVIHVYEWTNPITGEMVTQTRHAGEPKYLWPTGTKSGMLVYLGEPLRYDLGATRPIVWTEGAKAATFAALKLPADDFDVVGFVSATTIPNASTLEKIAKGRPCVVWPDDDDPGAKAGQRLVSALSRSSASAVTIDPALLGLTGGHGHDAEQWHPDDSPSDELRAACVAATPSDVEHEHFRSIWTYTAEATPDVLIPGLAWKGRVSKIAAAPKLGKTSLLTNGIAAWQDGREFLGEQTGPPGSVLYVSETGIGVLRAWFEHYGCPTDAPIIVGGCIDVETIAAAARKHEPELVVIDSLTDLHAASDGGNLWNAGDCRKLLQPLRALGCAVVLVHHVRKSDGVSRDSGDLEAAPDMNITFDPGFAFGGPNPPPGDRRLRYSGRWTEPERTLTFDEAGGYALKKPTGGKGPTGEGDPFTAKGPAPTLIDETLNDYIMQHPESSGRQIRAALGCQQRELQPSLARLEVARRIASKEGPRKAKLWSVATSGSPTGSPIFEPDEPDEPDNENGGKPNKPDRPVQLVQTLTKETPEPDEPDDLPLCRGTDRPVHDIGSSGEQRLSLAGAKVTMPPIAGGGAGALAKIGSSAGLYLPNVPPLEHLKRKAASDLPGGGKVAPRLQYAPPTRHVSGTKRWHQATGTWVDVTEADLVSLLKAGITPRVVRLDNGFTVRDGSAHIHVPSRWSNADGSGGMSLRLELVPGSESVTVN